MKNPVTEKKFELKAYTKNVKNGRRVKFSVAWLRGHSDWDSVITGNNNSVERREIPSCGRDVPGKTVSGDETAVDWPVNWMGDEFKNNTEMEIYAVIRAEYRFIKDNGWTKLHAKKHAQGMDNLFKKGQGDSLNYAVVESKCFGDRGEYEKYIVADPAKSPLGKLKTPQGELVDGKPMSTN